jgi:hypothetical protein
MKKLTLILDQTNWLEATWVEDEIQVHCESYSGHPEHIAMLRAKALEFETSLEDYEDLIAECEKNFIAPTEEEIQAEITLHLVNEAKNYLASTDYKMTVDYFATLDKVTQDELVAERQKAREFIRANS